MRIYRVEHIDSGKGPFWNTSQKVKYGYLHDANRNRPNPRIDSGIGYRFRQGMDVIGCASKAQLCDWFEKHIAMLESENFIVRVFDTDDYTKGIHQVAFARRDEDIVGEHLLSEFFA